jgi:hypothetical protein
MNPLLRRKIYQTRREVEKLGGNTHVKSTGSVNAVIFHNDERVALLSVSEKTGRFQAYTVDVHKWVWAESEGFSRNEILKKLKEDIFLKIEVEDLPISLL